MPMTTTLSNLYDNLKAMDNKIQEAEAHIRVMAAVDNPAVTQLRNTLEIAKKRRADMLKAIETEANHA